jgi:hypothetical protein
MRLLRSPLCLALLGFVLAGGTLAAQTTPRIHLDLEGNLAADLAASPFPIPPNGSGWHELAPAWCTPYVQNDYFDTDGDGTISRCDGIKLNGRWYHIVWVGWTLFCSDGTWVLEPVDDITADATFSGKWLEVAPNYGRVHSAVEWTRADGTAVDAEASRAAGTGSPRPLPGDSLSFEAAPACNVVRVSVDIIVEPR